MAETCKTLCFPGVNINPFRKTEFEKISKAVEKCAEMVKI